MLAEEFEEGLPHLGHLVRNLQTVWNQIKWISSGGCIFFELASSVAKHATTLRRSPPALLLHQAASTADRRRSCP